LNRKIIALAALALLAFSTIMTVAAILPAFASVFGTIYSLPLDFLGGGSTPCGDPVEGGGFPE
jgi:hypothetical protein